MNAGRREAVDKWLDQANLPVTAQVSDRATVRATVIFDIDGYDITVTFYYRSRAHRYPPGQPN
jgi:hypothetical protein